MEDLELTDVTLVQPIIKCSYYNRGHCKYMKKGCRFSHPEEVCNVFMCKSKACPKRHPKSCKYRANCVHKKSGKCSYDHTLTDLSKDSQSHNNSVDITNKLNFAMGLISKQENTIKALSEKLNEEIYNLKMKLAMFEN